MKKTLLFLFAILTVAVAQAGIPVRNATKVNVKSMIGRTEARKAPTRQAIDYSALQWEKLGEGVYKDAIMCGMYGGGEEDPRNVTIEVATDNPAIYRVVNPYPEYSAGDDYLIIDATDPDYVIVPYQKTNVIDTEDGPVWVASVSVVYQEEGIEKDEFLASAPQYNIYTEPKSVIVLPARSVLFRFAEAPPSSAWGTDPEGYYMGAATVSGYLVLPGGEYISEWEDLGKGTMVDQVFAPIFQPESDPTPYEVDIQKSRKREGIYRILNPWQHFNAPSAPLEINMSQPDFVVVDNQSTGLYFENMGLAYVMSGSYGWEKDDFLASEYAYENITFVDNRLLLPENSLGAFLPEYDGMTLYFADEKYGESYIDFPESTAINEASATNNHNAPIEYFNLQGMKVSQPQNGVYLRRQGSSVVKVIINNR